VADVESKTEENGKLKQVVDNLNAETKKLKQEQDTVARRHQQAQEELGPLKMELSMAVADLKKARTNQDTQQREIDCQMGELGKKSFLAQANLKKIVEKFREKTNVVIQIATATALQGWSEQAADYRYCKQTRPTGISMDPDYGS
jgi:chromosome segregation ATPase